MRRKNYLLEALSEDEEKYIICAIKKAYLSALRKYSDEIKLKKYSLDDVYIQSEIPSNEDEYFKDESVEMEDWNNKLPLSKTQQDSCVRRLTNLALKFDLDRYIRTLTYQEKLVFFLSEICGISHRKQEALINLNRATINKRYKTAKNKIEMEKRRYEDRQ